MFSQQSFDFGVLKLEPEPATFFLLQKVDVLVGLPVGGTFKNSADGRVRAGIIQRVLGLVLGERFSPV